jgi:L-fuconolactonase
VTESSRPRRIDSHVHFWDPAWRDYPWMPDELGRPFGPDALRPLLTANELDAAVLVQTVSGLEETRQFLRIAADEDIVAAVVGWVDLTDPHAPNLLQELRASEHGRWLAGIRHQVHDEESPDWLQQEAVQVNLDALADQGLVYDLLLRTRELPSGIAVARDFPHLRFVVDHIAKPPIASGEIEPWATLMHEFADLEHVACKLSGMVTEADPAHWTPDDLKPYVATVWDVFGPDRLMFGSDWPVCTLAASYDRVVDALRTVLDDLGVLDEHAETAIFGGTAAHWYGLDQA